MKTHRYLIECLTNLHVGSGEENVGVVDNRVQRDATTAYPVIHGSGIKGALRSHFQHVKKESPERIVQWFGSDVTEKGTLKQGDLIFTDAQLVSLPVRANVVPFFHAVAEGQLRLLSDWFRGFEGAELAEALSRTADAVSGVNVARIQGGATPPHAEDVALQAQPDLAVDASVLDLVGSQFASLRDEQFIERCNHLPIVARNQLENGVSRNLWYEELVPHHARFVTAVVDKGEVDFDLDGMRVQIGANATIGYGWVQFKKLP